LRSRSGRLHTFADNDEVFTAINGLVQREGEPMLVKLPRTPGRKDSEYMHLFSGAVDVEAHVAEVKSGKVSGDRVTVAELLERVQALEAEVAELKKST
jgi:uncharacterized protein YceH (UPF0502 family)